MKIGILGGSFDPPHLGHLSIAEEVLKKLHLDEVWFVPAFVSPHKLSAPPVEASHRMKMLELMLHDKKHFKALDIELKKEKPSYTVDTLKELKKSHPKDEFFLIMGDDQLRVFLSWKDPEEIVKLARLVIVRRGEETDIAFLKNILPLWEAAKSGLLSTSLYPISSTEIRQLIKDGGDLKGFLTDSVIEYIKDRGLYTETS